MESIEWDRAAIEFLKGYQGKLIDTLVIMGLKEDGKFNEKFVEWVTVELKRVNNVIENFLINDNTDIEINTDDNVDSVDVSETTSAAETHTPSGQ